MPHEVAGERKRIESWMKRSQGTVGKWFTRRARLGYLLGVLILVVAFAFGFASQSDRFPTIGAVVVVVFVAAGYFILRRQWRDS